MNKTKKIILTILGVLLAAVVIYIGVFAIGMNRKYKGLPFDSSKIEGYENWENTKVEILEKDLLEIELEDMDNMIIDKVEDEKFYVYPSLPTEEGYIFNQIIKNDGKEILEKEIIEEIKDLKKVKEFSGYPIQNIETYNKVFNEDENLMSLNIGSKIYVINTDTFEWKVVKEFEDDQDYTRRFRYFWLDKDKIYYILNDRDEKGNYEDVKFGEVPKNELIIENINTNKVEKVNLDNRETVDYSDFIHFKNIGWNNYILFTEGNKLRAYNVESKEDIDIIEKEDYYFSPGEIELSEKYYIERSLYVNRYGMRIFDRESGEILNTIVGNDRYGNIHNLKIYNEKYLLADGGFDSNLDNEDFKIIDLDNQKVYSIAVNKALDKKDDLSYRVIGLDNENIYIQVIEEKDKDIEIYKLPLEVVVKNK